MMGDYVTLKQCVLIHIISILEKYSTVSIFIPIMSDYVISILISRPCISNSLVCNENISFDYWRSHIVFERKPHRWLQCKFMLRSNVILFIYSFTIPKVGQWSDLKVYRFQNKVLILTNNIFKLFVGFAHYQVKLEALI